MISTYFYILNTDTIKLSRKKKELKFIDSFIHNYKICFFYIFFNFLYFFTYYIYIKRNKPKKFS